MNPSMPRADAVLVRGDRIVEVGSRRQMQPWLDHHPHQIDDRFSDCFICPGFIDPHLHPAMAAVLLPMKFVTAMRWKLPWGTVEPTTSETGFTEKMSALNADLAPEEPLFIWGYHQLWHGDMSRARINAVSSKRPIVVWHRSFHELVGNDAAFELLGVQWEQIKDLHEVNWYKGHFWENFLAAVLAAPWVFASLNSAAMFPSSFEAFPPQTRPVVSVVTSHPVA